MGRSGAAPLREQGSSSGVDHTEKAAARPPHSKKLAVVEPAGGLLGVVGEEDRGAGALDAGQDFEDYAFFVKPAFGYGGFDHGVFAANVVGAYGNIEFVAHGADYIEVREGGLDHYHVRAFFQIERDFFQGFAGVGGIHLVAAAVAELRCGLRGFAERTVETGAIFRGVGKNGDIFKLVFIEFFADGGDAAVHHVGRRYDVRAGASVREGLFGEDGDRRIVGDARFIGQRIVLDHAAVAVVGVFAETNVSDDEKFQIGLADGFDGALDYSLGGERACAARIFGFGKAEQNDSGNPQRFYFPALFYDLIGGLLIDIRHGADFLADFSAGADEHGIDEAGGGELRFADQAAESLSATQAAGTMGWEGHGDWFSLAQDCGGW